MTTASSHSSNDIELAVTLGRIEEMLKSMNEKLDRLDSTAVSHADILRKHTVEIELLKQRQGPRVHWSALAATLISAVSLSASFILWVSK
jgi:hypothetical protein